MLLQKTKAFHKLKDDVPKEVKTRRQHEIAAVFRREADKLNRAQIGQTQIVLIEGVSFKTRM